MEKDAEGRSSRPPPADLFTGAVRGLPLPGFVGALPAGAAAHRVARFADMKAHLLLATVLILVGCGRQEPTQREVLATLDNLKTELAAKRSEPVRWAFANKREIDSAIFQWSQQKMEEAKKSEALAPEIEEKIRQYETLQAELTRKRIDAMRLRFPPSPGASGVAASDPEYEALADRVAQAKAPVAEIIDARNRRASQLRDEFTADKLVAEYAKGRFDLVVDSSDQSFSRSAVLYRTAGEVLDITDGVIKLFRERANP